MKTIPLSEWVDELESGARPKGGIKDGVGEIPSLGAEHLSDNGGFNFTKDKRIPYDFFRSMVKGHIRQDDILIVKDGATTGKTSFVNGSFPYEEAAINEHVFRLSVQRKRADPRFVFRYLQSPLGQQQIMTDFRGATVGGIGRTFVGKVFLPDFSLDEQRRIAAILDKADGIRRKRAHAIAMAEAATRSAFLEMFGSPARNPKNWPILSIAELGNVQGGLQVSRARDSHTLRKPYLRVANVFRDRLDLTEIKEIGLTQSEFNRVKLLDGDVLIVEGHGNPEEIGRTAVWDGLIDDCVHQNHLIRFRTDRSIVLPDYVSRLLNSESGRRQLIAAGRTTSGLNTISTTKVKEVLIPVPPIQLQRRFAQVIQGQKHLTSRMRRDESQAAGLFGSIVQRAFSGKL